MKKLIILCTVLALCISLVACGGSGNADHDYILSLLEKGEYDKAIQVIEMLRDSETSGEARNEMPVEGGYGVISAPGETIVEENVSVNGNDWEFRFPIINGTDSNLTLIHLEICDRVDGTQIGVVGFDNEQLEAMVNGATVLEPGIDFEFADAHPIVSDFNQREYVFIYLDDAGQEYIVIHVFDLKQFSSGAQETAQQTGGRFPITLTNTTPMVLELVNMDAAELFESSIGGTSIYDGPDSLASVGLGDVVLQPGESFQWFGASPVPSDMTGRYYRFHFTTEGADGWVQSLHFIDYSQNETKNLRFLRHDVMFETEVHPGVYWVPAVRLGGSRYTNAQIYKMTDDSPEEKQENISTLYEALQLYQVGNFQSADDNIRMMENDINWEHHKPGYYAVQTNCGCCATDSNWLHYILDGDYEQIGYIATSQRDGGGHVYNYIFHDGWYYIIDLTHYRTDGDHITTAVEEGNMDSYMMTDRVLGNIHKTQSLQAFSDYVQSAFGDPPGLMVRYSADDVPAVDGIFGEDGSIEIVYADMNNLDIEVIFDDPTDNLSFRVISAPSQYPDWE